MQEQATERIKYRSEIEELKQSLMQKEQEGELKIIKIKEEYAEMEDQYYKIIQSKETLEEKYNLKVAELQHILSVKEEHYEKKMKERNDTYKEKADKLEIEYDEYKKNN